MTLDVTPVVVVGALIVALGIGAAVRLIAKR
jgi:hypothetical protein